MSSTSLMAQYFSQCGQDAFIARLFNFKNNGFFVDIGASDGIKHSNSYYFEKNLKWNGICVEPRRSAYDNLKNNRHCTCINACIAKDEIDHDFCEVEGPSDSLSGLVSSYYPAHTQRIDNEIAQLGGKKNIYKVKCLNFNKLMTQYNIQVIDFLSIDTEGSEFEILNSIDFGKITVRVICVENNYNDNCVNKLLISKGFIFKTKLAGQDDVYVHPKFFS